MSAASRSVAVVLTATCVALTAYATDAPPAASPDATPPAATEPGPAAADPVLDALVAEALERNPDLRAAESALDAARARPAQERALPDPMVSVAFTNDGWSPSLGTRDMTTLALTWSQELPWPGKLGLRGEVAARGAEQVQQQLERARLGLRAATARAYYGLLLARERLELVQEQAELWKQIEGVARARYAVGQGAQQDVLRVQVEVTRVEELQARQEAEAEIRRAEINRLRDRSLGTPLETSARLREDLAGAGGDAEPLWERLRAASPEIAATRLATEQERLAVRLAQREFKPDFSVQAGYMNRGGLDPMWQAGVGVRLPLRRERRHAGVAEAEARLRAAERRAEDLELQLRYRTHERLTQLRTLERVAQLYGHGIIPQDRMSVEAAVANYQAGKVPFVAVLEALSTLYGDRSLYLGLLSDHAVTRVGLEEARLDGGSSMSAPAAGSAGPAFGTGGMGAATASPMSSK